MRTPEREMTLTTPLGKSVNYFARLDLTYGTRLDQPVGSRQRWLKS
jgi:hypothetical protein